jgi:hypothetical protein
MAPYKIQYTGLITAVLMIAASLFSFYILKNPVESNFQLIVYLLFAAGIVFALFNHSKVNSASKTFKDFFSVGFKTFVLVALAMALFTFAFFSANTAFRDAKITENTKLIIAAGNHLPNEIAENERQLRKMFMPIMISSAVFRYLIIGALTTAVAAGFLSRKKEG